ncbi:MAG: hypothetical protein Q8M29_15015 [Bacteroidota bacterium]|nr:hypothetical protein [Bacteroidota bacterium]
MNKNPKNFLLIFCLLLSGISYSQKQACDTCSTKKKLKGSFYFLWGYNRDWYAKSTIHFRNEGDPAKDNQFGSYDFKIYDVTAQDRPDFHQLNDITNFSIPQFSTRIGYYFNDKNDQGIELNYDHSKYVVNDWQKVRIKGTAHGTSFDKDTVLNPNYIHFEHTDGANFALVNYVKRWKLKTSNNKKHTIAAVIKPGIGFVYPRTDVTIFESRLNNDWHIAGACVGLETGIRGELWKHFTFELTGKGVAANYSKCLVQGKGNGKASHRIACFEAIFCLGYTL